MCDVLGVKFLLYLLRSIHELNDLVVDSTLVQAGPINPWRRLQREAGEEPESDEAQALSRLRTMFGAKEAV